MQNPTSANQPSDTTLIKTEILISSLLRYGVYASALVMATGLMMMLFGASSADSSELLKTLVSGATLPVQGPPLHGFADAFVMNGANISAVGILMLISLPILRVALTMILFIIEKDWIFFAITFFVLTVLIAGLFMGAIH